MIPVEQYAADTRRMAGLAEELDALDQAWTVLRQDFDRIASSIQGKQASGEVAGQELRRLSVLDANLTALELRAVAVMDRLTSILSDAGHD